jgi:ABC-type multidrug transport system ATPase subunit
MIDTQEEVMEAVPVRLGAAVEVHELRKVFTMRDRKKGRRFGKRTRTALDGVTFSLERGETVAILGQNGSGKSTLVRLLSTLLLPDGGSAHILGHDVVAEHRAVRRVVNRVSVEASFFKKMSAAENLSYAARFYGMTAKQTRDKIPEILERVGFPHDRRDESMENLSRGRCSRHRSSCSLTSRPRGSTHGRSWRCRTSSARSVPRTTRRSCSARTTSWKPRLSR